MRKPLVILAAAIAFALTPGADTAQARDGVYRSVAIDTSRIAATGHRHFAGTMKEILAGELSKALGPRLGRSGGVLTVRITSIRIMPNAGTYHEDAANSDRLEGVVIVPGRGAIPIRVQLPPGTAGAWYTPGHDERRVYQLIAAFAQWAAREA
jgi:hypothetical protein